MPIPLEEQLSEVLLKLQGYSAESIQEVEVNGRKEIYVSINSVSSARCPICKKEVPIYDRSVESQMLV